MTLETSGLEIEAWIQHRCFVFIFACTIYKVEESFIMHIHFPSRLRVKK